MAQSVHLWIPGPLPGLNEVIDAAKGYGGRGYGYSKLKRQWTNTIDLLARAAKVPSFSRVHMAYRWVERNQRRDPSNVACAKKFVEDGLVEADVLANDGWKQIAGFSDEFEVGPEAGVAVSLKEGPLIAQLVREGHCYLDVYGNRVCARSAGIYVDKPGFVSAAEMAALLDELSRNPNCRREDADAHDHASET
jgi:hypothetical protein